MTQEAFFLADENAARGQRFCVFHAPGTPSARAAVLYVHPFAEEMNKSRRMAALQSRALAAAGCAVLQIDLLGCGDSSGDLPDASWEDWVLDVLSGARWLESRFEAPLWLWGLRVGGLLASEAAARIGRPCNLLLWSPSTSGKAALQQFLRLKSAADMLGGRARGGPNELIAKLEAGEAVDVAGYRVPPALAEGMRKAVLQPAEGVARMEWLEVSTSPNPEPSPAATQAAATWRGAGCDSRVSVVNGSAFWQTTEIETAPELIPATLAAVLNGSAA